LIKVQQDVDTRHKAGHDELSWKAQSYWLHFKSDWKTAELAAFEPDVFKGEKPADFPVQAPTSNWARTRNTIGVGSVPRYTFANGSLRASLTRPIGLPAKVGAPC
jgi:hypothetical protein